MWGGGGGRGREASATSVPPKLDLYLYLFDLFYILGVSTQLKFLKKQFKLDLWGNYSNASDSCTH